jgi:uncharacterized OsmC-like protein
MSNVEAKPKLTSTVHARRVDAHGSEARCKGAVLVLDTDLADRRDACNPAELLLTAVAACLPKGIERFIPILKFELRVSEVRIEGIGQNSPARMESITYDLLVDSDESDRRFELLHENVRKFGTVFNTLASGTKLEGTLRRVKLPA